MVLKKFLAVSSAIFVLFAVLILPSCAPNDENLTDYAARGFAASVSFARGGVNYAARVVAGEPRRVEEGIVRDLELSFTAPKSMAGIRVTRRGGVMTSVCGDVELEGDVGGWLELAELLTAGDIGRLVSIDAGRGAAEGQTIGEFLLRDGRRCLIRFDNTSGLPISVGCGEDELQIIFFEK